MVSHQDPKQLIFSERQAATQRALESIFVELLKQAEEASKTDPLYSKFQTTIKDESQVILPIPPGTNPKVNFFVEVELRINRLAGTTGDYGRVAAELAKFVTSEYALVINMDNLHPSAYELDRNFLRQCNLSDTAKGWPLGIADASLTISLVSREPDSVEKEPTSKRALLEAVTEKYGLPQLRKGPVQVLFELVALPDAEWQSRCESLGMTDIIHVAGASYSGRIPGVKLKALEADPAILQVEEDVPLYPQ